MDSVQSVGTIISQYWTTLTTNAPSLIYALIFFVAWLFAISIFSSWFRKTLFKTLNLNRLFKDNVYSGFSFNIEHIISKILFFGLLLVGIKVAAQIANIEALDQSLDSVFGFMGVGLAIAFRAIVPLVIALVLATLVRKGIFFLGKKFNLDQAMSRQMGEEGTGGVALTRPLGDIAYGLVFLILLPGILAGLGLHDVQAPFTRMLEQFGSYLPNIFGAGIIFVVGWFIAKIVRDIVTSVLQSLGTQNLVNNLGIGKYIGTVSIPKLVGTIVYSFILILILLQGLRKLGLEQITQPLETFLNEFYSILPNLVFAVFIIGIAYYIGKILCQIISQLLHELGFDNIFSKLGLSSVKYGSYGPSKVVGKVVFYGLVLMATQEALMQLGLLSFADILDEMVIFATQVLFGVVIFGLGLYIANIVSDLIKSSTVENAKLLSLLAKSGILVLAGAMALTRMGLADGIIEIAFALTAGAVALGAGLAFGLGGKEAAAEALRKFKAKL